MNILKWTECRNFYLKIELLSFIGLSRHTPKEAILDNYQQNMRFKVFNLLVKYCKSSLHASQVYSIVGGACILEQYNGERLSV